MNIKDTINNHPYFKIYNKLFPTIKKIYYNSNKQIKPEINKVINKCSNMDTSCRRYINEVSNKAINNILLKPNLMSGGNFDPKTIRDNNNLNKLIDDSAGTKLQDIEWTNLKDFTEEIKKIKQNIRDEYAKLLTQYTDDNTQKILGIMQVNDISQVHINYIKAILDMARQKGFVIKKTDDKQDDTINYINDISVKINNLISKANKT